MIKQTLVTISVAIGMAAGLSSGSAQAGDHENSREPRARGVVQHGMQHHVVMRPGAPVTRFQVYHENRSIGDIRRDPHIVVFNHVGWHPVGHWDHWYRDWGVFWRVTDWNAIRTVTCEAVNTQTQYLYPVTETRADSWYWNTSSVNSVAARALDECVADAGNPNVCSLVQGECWNSIY